MNKFKNEETSFAILPIILFCMIDIFFCIYNKGIIMITAKAMCLSLLICFLLYFILIAITKKTYKAITILAVFFLLFSIINQIKIAYTDEPIVFSDILYLNSSGELLGIIDGTVWDTIKNYVPTTIVYSIVTIIICLLAYKYNVDIKDNRYRIILAVIPIILLGILFIPSNYTRNKYLNFFFEVNERKDYAMYTTNMGYFLNYGVISGMYGQMLESRIEIPKDYDETIIENEIAKENNDKDNSLGTPNIIVVFSESFWDIEQLEEIKFNTEVTSNFNRLKEEGIFFNMISPSYGGVSANVEFEFLTGVNLMYFNKGYIPYMQLYREKSYFNKPSIISELKNNGYKTKIVAYTSEKLFECGRFYNYIGVDEKEFITEYCESEIKGTYVSDESVIDKIIYEFNKKEDGEKLFYMTLTMQSHMPYLVEKYDNYDVYVEESNLPQEMNDTLTSYAQGIYDADKQLARLYDYINTLQEPTIIIFYGDHLPYLYTKDGENVIDELEYFNAGNELENIYRKYNTQSLILANFEINKDNDIKYLGPDLLGTYVLNRMDIDISEYYKWLYRTKDIISASNYYITIDNEGNLYKTDELEETKKTLYNLRKNIQYKYFIK